jgi:predicted NBD/HSP70 family sugar kinase
MKNNQYNSITFQSIKETNYKSVLYTIEEKKKISRSEISRITTLSPATVTNACDILLQKGLILELCRGFSVGGRKPIFLEINPDAGKIIGVLITKDTLRIVISNLKCEIIYSSIFSINTNMNLLQFLIEMIYEMISFNQYNDIIGIGVSIDYEYDYNQNCSKPIYGIEAKKLSELLIEKFTYPVYIDKSSNLCAIAEYSLNYSSKVSDLIYLNFDNMISSGIIMNNSILRTGSSNLGDISHFSFIYGGPPCTCGRNGCVNSFCTIESLIDTAVQGLLSGECTVLSQLCNNVPYNVNEFTIAQSVTLSDAFSEKIVKEYINYLSLLVDSLIQLYNPKVIILGGRLSVFKNIITNDLCSKIRGINEYNKKNIIIDYSHFGDNSALKGACKMALLHSFTCFDLG